MENKTEDKEEEKSDKAEETKEKEKDLFHKSGEYDLTLKVDGHRVCVCKAVLCIASPVFKAMMKSGFRENDQEEIELPGKNYEDFVEFLSCVYPDKLKYVTADNVYRILPLVVEYQVQVLIERCETLIMQLVRDKYSNNAKELYHHLQMAELYCLKELENKCIYLASELKAVDMDEGFSAYSVSDSSVLRIRHLSLKRKDLDQEDDMFIFKLSLKQNNNHGHACDPITVRDIVKRYIERDYYNADYKTRLRVARMYKRYFLHSSDIGIQLSYITSHLNGLTTDKIEQFKEELDLLPDIIKRTLTII